MQIKMFSEMINKELSFLLPRTLILISIIYACTLPIYKFGIEIPLGLILGTIVMLLNFVILGFSSERAVEKPVGSAKRLMFGSYILRLLIVGVLFVCALKFDCINLIAATIPQFFPKVIYTLDAAAKNRKGG